MKQVLFIIAAVAGLALAFIGGFRSFTGHIYARQDCERFNIDNIELRTGIDIPAVLDVDCECAPNSKTSRFVLDTEKVDIEAYIARNEFVLEEERYLHTGQREDTKWEAVLDTKSNELHVAIEYLD